MPDSHRAAALRLAWARRQLQTGRATWNSPEILTWDAWLERQWRAAVQAGLAPPAQLLSASQERALWEGLLREAATGPDPELPALHAAGLARAAARAAQSLLVLSRSAMGAEERLLADTLVRLRTHCEAQGLLSLRLAPPEALGFVAAVPPPVIAGQPRLTPLQRALQQQYWSDAPLLLDEPAAPTVDAQLRRFAGPEAEIAACAAWCIARLRDDPTARLLVLSAVADPPLAIQGVQLWQGIAGGLRHDATLHERLLAVEGGESLRHQALIEDALAALACLEPTLDTERLFALLASPYFNFASVAEGWGLQGWFEQRGRARWERGSLRTALTAAAPRHPAANRLLAWLEALWQLGAVTTPLPAATWAGQFSDVLAAAGFGSSPGLDSREQQRLARWSALLDEFAGLDAVLPPLHAREALVQLGRLAAQGRHQGASGDAAVTLSDGLGDPVIDYDGIWVLGLAETRWPPPPRPDPYVALAEQRRSHWPESSAGEQRAQAAWALARWQRRTRELVLSHAEMEGDLRHRPTSLLGATAGEWRAEQGEAALPTLGQGQVASDQSFPPLAASTLDKPLGGGVERLRVQRDCPFRAHAQWRLAARAPDPLSDGVTATLRGRLLHLLLQGLWGELRTQQRLLALDPPAERELLERHWREALRHPGAADAAWLPERVLAREHRRALRLVARVLELERQRAPFEVVGRERELTWPEQGARLTLRIDRIDRTATGERLLIDYKSGAPRGLALHKGELEPLQLAVYAAALADRGEPVTGAALLGLAPGELGYASAGRDAGLLPGMKPVDDWDGTTQRWRAELLRLLEEHLAGGAPLAAGLEACRYCHLPALCRRATDDAAEDDDVS